MLNMILHCGGKQIGLDLMLVTRLKTFIILKLKYIIILKEYACTLSLS